MKTDAAARDAFSAWQPDMTIPGLVGERSVLLFQHQDPISEDRSPRGLPRTCGIGGDGPQIMLLTGPGIKVEGAIRNVCFKVPDCWNSHSRGRNENHPD